MKILRAKTWYWYCFKLDSQHFKLVLVQFMVGTAPPLLFWLVFSLISFSLGLVFCLGETSIWGYGFGLLKASLWAAKSTPNPSLAGK